MTLNRGSILSVAFLMSGMQPAVAQVRINEFSYDDSGTDDIEYVELYNAGPDDVDIGGWVLGGNDPSGPNTSFTIPAGTILAGGDYYVLGAATVAAVNQVVGVSNIWENDNESLQLRNAGGMLIDAVIYEANLGTAFAPADVLAAVGGGIWGNKTTIQSTATTDTTLQSWSRWTDGHHTGNNGRDFGLRPMTPGANNVGSAANITRYSPTDVDGMLPGTEVSGLTGSFRNPRVIDPTDASTMLAGNDLNPNAIPPSPQGGNAIIAWDVTGGGDTSHSNDFMQGNASFDLFVYLDTTPIGQVGAEVTTYGLAGTSDTFHNFPDTTNTFFPDAVTSNGNTGIGWIFEKEDSANLLHLRLVDFGDGGDSSDSPATPADWDIIASIDMHGVASAWHRLGLSYDAATGMVTATLDDQVFMFATEADLVGSFYTGYRESLAGTPLTLRPPTFDLVPEPGTLVLLAIGALAVARRRR